MTTHPSFATAAALVILTTAAFAADLTRTAQRHAKDIDLELPGKGGVITMIWCPPGSFHMGSPKDESGRREDETRHQVTLTEEFWLSETEVTQGQWSAIMKNTIKQLAKRQDMRFGELAGVGDGHPMYNVTLWDAQKFCRKLTQYAREKKKIPGNCAFALPTEAQWEYACRAGTTTALNNGTELSDRLKCPHVGKVAWFRGNNGYADCPRGTQKVGQKQPNPWGFYDMLGNVAEWCADRADFDLKDEAVRTEGTYRAAETNPRAWKGRDAVYRGGAWSFPATFCRSAARRCQHPATRGTHVGFRIALVKKR